MGKLTKSIQQVHLILAELNYHFALLVSATSLAVCVDAKQLDPENEEIPETVCTLQLFGRRTELEQRMSTDLK